MDEITRRTMKQKLMDGFNAVATSPAFWLPAGNAVLAYDQATETGLAVAVALAALTTTTQFASGYLQKPMGLPMWLLGLKNYYLAYSVAQHGIDAIGLENMLDITNEQAREKWFAISAFFMWASGHMLQGQIMKDEKQAILDGKDYKEGKLEPPRDLIYAAGNAATVEGNIPLTLLFALSGFRAIKKPAPLTISPKHRKNSCKSKEHPRKSGHWLTLLVCLPPPPTRLLRHSGWPGSGLPTRKRTTGNS